ncbi:hypothetical protein C8R44DRAFT_883393 [Mycena epipterygia]|nr:hypothetical protein C8R44DRAFT_883393 [Mycena epipterygia]
MGVHDFDIICLQEPWEKEVSSFDHRGYFVITPSCDTRYRVSIYFKEASIPASSICPRRDLSSSPDILVVELISNHRRVFIINLYNDCETRVRSWIPTRITFLGHPLTLVTPPDIPTYPPLRNVIDLGFASPSLLRHVRNMEVNSRLRLGNDHLAMPESNRFNLAAMNLDKFLAVLRLKFDQSPLEISSQAALDEATDAQCNALVLAIGASTAKRRHSAHSKKWWSVELTLLLAVLSRKERYFRCNRVAAFQCAS